MPGRNDPCPCGSGKKYKKCCLAPQQQSADKERRARRLQQLQAEAVFKLLESESTPAESEEAQRLYEGIDAPGQHINTWMAVSVPGRIERYLEKADISDEERRVLQAELQNHYSVFEVVERRGACLTLDDKLRFETFELYDAHAAARLQLGRFLLVRAVDLDRISAVTGSFGGDLEFDRAQPIWLTMLAGREQVPKDELRRPEFTRALFSQWRLAEALQREVNARRSTMTKRAFGPPRQDSDESQVSTGR